MVWLAKLADITKLGWPVPQPRFTSRPLASKMMRLPSGKITWSTWGLISSQRYGASVATWISLSKWPMLQTMAWSFIASICSWRITSLLPVQVTKMSALSAAYSMVTTLYPSIAACSALMGSISATQPGADKARRAWAEPLPTSPEPATTATLPAIITSVARLMPSTRDSRQPYRLSNLLLVTESFTLNARNSSEPFALISFRRCTPVVVSSVTPMISALLRVYQVASSAILALMAAYSTVSSSLVGLFSTDRSFSARWPRCISSVASPPSSRIMFGPSPLEPFGPKSKMRWVKSQYSVSVSPLWANTGVPRSASAAAAWACVEKMLHDAQRTSAPRACSVSTSTAVWMVMCRLPVMRAPFSG